MDVAQLRFFTQPRNEAPAISETRYLLEGEVVVLGVMISMAVDGRLVRSAPSDKRWRQQLAVWRPGNWARCSRFRGGGPLVACTPGPPNDGNGERAPRRSEVVFSAGKVVIAPVAITRVRRRTGAIRSRGCRRCQSRAIGAERPVGGPGGAQLRHESRSCQRASTGCSNPAGHDTVKSRSIETVDDRDHLKSVFELCGGVLVIVASLLRTQSWSAGLDVLELATATLERSGAQAIAPK